MQNFSETGAIVTKKPPTYTIIKTRMKVSVANCIKNGWRKNFNKGTVYNGVGLYCICETISRQNSQLP